MNDFNFDFSASFNVRSILVVAFNKSIATEMSVRLKNPRFLPGKTAFQQAICDAVTNGSHNLVINALAGSGKTTTLEQICALYPDATKKAATLHSAGFSALAFYLKKLGKTIEVNEDKIKIIIKQVQRYDTLSDDDRKEADVCGYIAKRLIDLSRSHGHTSFLPEPSNEDLLEIVDKYDIEVPESDSETGMDLNGIFDLVRIVLESSNRIDPKDRIVTIDFEDMIHLPVMIKSLSFYRNDLILIDESQDLNPVQIAMVKKMRGRVVFVGDRNQAIYGFRGADVNAIDSIVEQFKATELPLSTCWRCPTSVIAEAQKLVPEIEAAPNAKEGKVSRVNTDVMMKMVEPGNFILCRTTAPLVSACMQLIRMGKPAMVRGRDIGQGLKVLASKIAKMRKWKGNPLLDVLKGYRTFQSDKLANDEAKLQAMQDKVDTLIALAEDCKNFADLGKKIDTIFSDTVDGDSSTYVMLSTAHKSKGLESERVFLIRPELMPFPFATKDWQIQQEMNLLYVVKTRSTNEFYTVPAKHERGLEDPTKKTA